MLNELQTSLEKELLRKIFVKAFLNEKGCKGVVQEIPSCPICKIKLDSRNEDIDFELKDAEYRGRKIDIVIPICPKCGARVKPAIFSLS